MKNKYKGWKAWLFPMEVGCRGFPSQSIWRVLTYHGVKTPGESQAPSYDIFSWPKAPITDVNKGEASVEKYIAVHS